MIGSGGSVFAPSLPRETYEQVYQNGPDEGTQTATCRQ
jgi:hypothetical protein